ncbi:hypothetical protein [Bacillus methanolicus]|uniref:hypothetical protein n=1 Tax=Bacillus methanolicus TaxID=1471 RepID=UPI002380A324|nr:hypothetical protein [Bacillus methanolicus]
MNQRKTINEPKVMKSAAGYYIGREIIKDDIPMPYDRLSDYFSSVSEAEEALKQFKK